jgi:hypothetical protein
MRKLFLEALKNQFGINSIPDHINFINDIYTNSTTLIYCHWFNDGKYKNVDFKAIEKDGDYKFIQSSSTA